MSPITGHCMCGAVTIEMVPEKPVIRACHCGMCRRQTSSAFMSVPSVPGSIKTTGPVTVFKSSDWAERAFCATCGSTLWYAIPGIHSVNLSAGLFEDAAGGTLKHEFHIDSKPAGYAFVGDHKKLTEAECIALFAPSQGDTL